MTTDFSIPLDDFEDLSAEQGAGMACAYCGRMNPLDAAFCYYDGSCLLAVPPPVPSYDTISIPPTLVDEAPILPVGLPDEIVAVRHVAVEDPFAVLRNACASPMPDWVTILFAANEARENGHVLPDDLRHIAAEAQRRMDCFQHLQIALAQGSLQGIAEAYDGSLLEDWAGSTEDVARGRQAVAAWSKIRELRELVKSSRSGRTLLECWGRYGPDVGTWAESEEIREVASTWEARHRAWDQLRRLARRTAPSERAIVQAWDQLQRAGSHPDADTVRERVEQAILRVACLDQLPARGASPSQDEDALMLRAWDEVLLAECPEAQREKPRYEQARLRLEIVANLDAAIAQSNQSALREKAIRDLARRLPADYRHKHLERVGVATERFRAATVLDKALLAKPNSDLAIAAAFDQAQNVGLRLDAKRTQRCQLATQRRQCLNELGKIDRRSPLDQRDNEWLKCWDDLLLRDCCDADPVRAEYAEVRARVEAWRALKAAIDAHDLDHIVELATNPLIAHYPPLAALGPQWLEAVTREKKRDGGVECKESGVLTFVFTDMVNSTMLKAKMDGDTSAHRDASYRKNVKTPHDTLLKNLVQEDGGHIHDGVAVGDAFCFRFEDTEVAVCCALKIQKRLMESPISTPLGNLSVRIGLHTGFVNLADDNSGATALDRGARIRSCAASGEVLVSQATHALVVKNLRGVKFTKKGTFDLKGLDAEEVYLANWADLLPTAPVEPPSSGAPEVALGPVLQNLVEQAQSLRRIEELLRKQDAAAFVDQIDFEYVRDHGELYLPYQQAMNDLVERWLRECAPIGKTEPVWTQDPMTGLVMVRWSWRFFGRVSHCLVAVSSERFFQTVADAGGQTMRWDVESHRRSGGGIELLPVAGRRRMYVTVWPAVDLGWAELLGGPLHLGPAKIQARTQF